AALAAYQRTIVSGNSRFDKWRYGGAKDAMTVQEIAGFKLFTGRAKCASCHQIQDTFALFTDQAFHDIGYGWKRHREKKVAGKNLQDLGRFEVTGDPRDRWRYCTPSLRNIALTAPYMHDGGLETLEDVIRFYNGGGAPHDGQDIRIRKLDLSNKEIAALAAFLRTLTGDNIAKLVEDARTGHGARSDN
ncbi:MAG: cytochrome-c peroxidase, partial [Methyloligellaceae bacterium]